MPESESDEREITIFEMYADECKDVYHIVSESTMKTRVRLIKQQYKEFNNGHLFRKKQKKSMLEFIRDHGGIDKMKFRKLKVCGDCSKCEVEDMLLELFVESSIMRGNVVKSSIGSVSKQDTCKQYYKENREKHLQYVKNAYQMKREDILAKKRKKYCDKPKDYIHCNACNRDVLSSYYSRHCSCVAHLHNVI